MQPRRSYMPQRHSPTRQDHYWPGVTIITVICLATLVIGVTLLLVRYPPGQPGGDTSLAIPTLTPMPQDSSLSVKVQLVAACHGQSGKNVQPTTLDASGHPSSHYSDNQLAAYKLQLTVVGGKKLTIQTLQGEFEADGGLVVFNEASTCSAGVASQGETRWLLHWDDNSLSFPFRLGLSKPDDKMSISNGQTVAFEISVKTAQVKKIEGSWLNISYTVQGQPNTYSKQVTLPGVLYCVPWHESPQ